MAARSRTIQLLAGISSLSLTLLSVSPAAASSDADPDSVVAAVVEAAPTDLTSLDMERVGDVLEGSFSTGGGTELGVDPEDGLSFTSKAGTESASITLPNAPSLSDATVGQDGSVTFAGNASTPSINVLAADDAIRVSTVISSSDQAEEFAYDFGASTSVEVQPDGSALVTAEVDSDGDGAPDADAEVVTVLAVIDAPWAVDADGKEIPTRYVADGSVLTQVVEHRGAAATYPVVADPTFDSPNAFQVRVRFNRAETASIASSAWGGVVGSVSCGAMMAVCALASGTVAYQAGIAQNSKPKKCLQITATSAVVIPGLIWWVDTYSGRSCK